MYYVYFLKSERDGGLYIGRSENVESRLRDHNSEKVRSTKSRTPFRLLGFEKYQTIEESIKMEREYKKGFRREEIKRRYKIG